MLYLQFVFTGIWKTKFKLLTIIFMFNRFLLWIFNALIFGFHKAKYRSVFFLHFHKGNEIEAATRVVLCKKVFLEIWQNSQENTCDRVSFFIKLQARPVTLLKKRLCHKCFPVNFVKFLRTPFSVYTLFKSKFVSIPMKYRSL